MTNSLFDEQAIEAAAKTCHEESENFIGSLDTNLRTEQWHKLDGETKQIYLDDASIILKAAEASLIARYHIKICDWQDDANPLPNERTGFKDRRVAIIDLGPLPMLVKEPIVTSNLSD